MILAASACGAEDPALKEQSPSGWVSTARRPPDDEVVGLRSSVPSMGFWPWQTG